jgi:hypothetical protein
MPGSSSLDPPSDGPGGHAGSSSTVDHQFNGKK